MADTASSILLLRLQSLGSNTNLWGGYLNTAMQTLERGEKGYQAYVVTGDATISQTNYSATNDYAVAFIKFTGTPAAAWTHTLPARHNFMGGWNTSGQAGTIKCSGGTGVTIPDGYRFLTYCDGVDYYNAAPGIFPGGLTIAGLLHGVTAGVVGTDAVNVTQLAAAIAASVPLGTAGTLFNSVTDTTRGYLQDKIKLATGAALSTANPAGNEYSILPALAMAVGAAQTTSFAAAVNTRYGLTKSAAATITLPAAAAVGDIIQIEINGVAGLVTYALNGLKYYGSTTNPTSAQEGVQTFYYSGASRGWIDP